MAALMLRLINSLDEREWLVLQERTLQIDGGLTLGELGNRLCVSRERARQLEVKAICQMEQAAESDDYMLLRWRAWSLRQRLGIAVPAESKWASEAIEAAVNDIAEDQRNTARLLLLRLAGPYHADRRTGWLCCGPLPTWDLTGQIADEAGRIDEDALRSELFRQGLVSEAHDAWISQFGELREIRGQLYVWPRTIAERLLIVLRAFGEPTSLEAILEANGDERSRASTINVLHTDPRFIRSARDTFGLREWGGDQYLGVAKLIENEIDASGGSAPVSHIVQVLCQKFGARELTVRGYLSCPRFIIRNGMASVRTSFEDYVVQDDVAYTAHAYVLSDEALAWRTRVSVDMLRGSGSAFPVRIAGWLGLKPEDRLVFASDSQGGEVVLTWPSAAVTGPTLGSIRGLLSLHNCEEGDEVLLHFDRSLRRVACARLDVDSNGTQRDAASLVGLPAGSDRDQVLEVLATTLGTTAEQDSIERALRRRGEVDLATLLFGERDMNEFDDAVKHLRNLL